MQIKYQKQFQKQYAKLQERHKRAVDAAITAFKANPHALELYNHPLKGALVGHRSISAGFDLRLVFIEEDGYVVVEFVRVGTHSQLYGS